jgi:hypothetical protein
MDKVEFAGVREFRATEAVTGALIGLDRLSAANIIRCKRTHQRPALGDCGVFRIDTPSATPWFFELFETWKMWCKRLISLVGAQGLEPWTR